MDQNETMTYDKFPEDPVFGQFAFLRDNEGQKNLFAFIDKDIGWHPLRQEHYTACPYEFNSLIRNPDGTLPYEGPLTALVAEWLIYQRIKPNTVFTMTINGKKTLNYFTENSKWLDVSELVNMT